MADTAEIFQFPERRDDAQAPGPDRTGRSPQVEEGFTRIANELFEALIQAPLTDRERRVALAVVRLTYGWNKKADRIADSQIAEIAHLPRQKVNQVKQQLLAKKVLVVEGAGHGLTSLNKYFDEWELAARHAPKSRPDSGGDKRGDTVPHGGDKDCTPRGCTPKTEDNSVPKGTDDSSKKPKPRKWGEKIDHELVSEMVAAVSSDLDAPVKHNPTAWANEFRLMRQRDDRTVEQIRYLITWTAAHDFWAGIVLSPAKLRAKWDQLAKQVRSQRKPAQRQDGRTGMAQPKPHGSYTPTDMNNLPDWMRD
ncbi:replication protein [Chromohalobacter salexigens]|nr:replication protein [Chromohalobacter salexigens]